MKKEDDSNYYQRLEAAIGQLPTIEPSDRWEQDLLARINQPRLLSQGTGVTFRYTLLMFCVIALNTALLLRINNIAPQPADGRAHLLEHVSNELLITSQP
jgi:hypothetical protein